MKGGKKNMDNKQIQNVAEVIIERNGIPTRYHLGLAEADEICRTQEMGSTGIVYKLGAHPNPRLSIALEKYRAVGNSKTRTKVAQRCLWGEYEAVPVNIDSLPEELQDYGLIERTPNQEDTWIAENAQDDLEALALGN